MAKRMIPMIEVKEVYTAGAKVLAKRQYLTERVSVRFGVKPAFDLSEIHRYDSDGEKSITSSF